MKVIMTGGGTGGHIYPALAIADKIKEKMPSADILFIGTERGMENTIIPAHGYPIQTIPASGMNRKHLLKNIKTIKNSFSGYGKAKKIIKEFKPDIVIGTGGYVCGPVVYAAASKGIKTAIHEQNAFPGMTNKILSRYVDKVFISFEDARQYFKHSEKVICTGNPLRRAFHYTDEKISRKSLQIPEKDLVILCFGGSLGSAKINAMMMKVIELFHGVSGIQIFFVTGKNYYKKVLEKLEDEKMELKGNVSIFEYLKDMPKYITASDVVICRSGALTISELIASGKPAILIPSPNVTGNHQVYNAKVMADKGAAIMIEEKDLDEEKLIATVMKIKNNKELLLSMSEKSKALAKNNAADLIYENIKDYL